MRRNIRLKICRLALSCLVAWNCGSSGDGPTQPPPTLVPTTVTKAGDGQAGTVNAPLPANISVTVRDQNGDPMGGVTVNFTVTAGGGRTVGTSAVTTAQGVASVIWILGPASGSNNNSVTAGMTGYSGPVPTFTASANPGSLARLTKLAGDTQTGEVVQALPVTLKVLAQDALGNPVVGASINWNVIGGRGTSSPSSSLTDASGVATTVWTPGPVVGMGIHKLRAVATSTPWVDFTASASLTSGTVTIGAGDNQAGVIGAATPVRPGVVVKTPGGSGIPVEAVYVQWEVTAGGGSLSWILPFTDAEGASSVEWTLGGTVGTNNQALRATVAGLTGSPVSFAASATARPTRITQVSGDGQAGTVGTLLPQPLVVLVEDSAGTPVGGTGVIWDFPEGNQGGITDAQGLASLDFTLFPAAGPQLVGARVPTANDPSVIVLFHFTASPGPAAQIEAASGGFQTATVGADLPEPVSVRVRDAYGNVKSGATVEWVTADGSTSVPSSVTDSNGLAETRWTVGTVAGTRNQVLTARLAAVPGAEVSLVATALPGPPASMTVVSGDGQSAVIGTPLPAALVVSVSDVYGNPISGLDVRWGPGVGGGWTTYSSVRTNASGISTVTRTLGAGVGTQTTVASISGATPLSTTFSSTGTSFTSQYNIDVRYLTPVSPSRQIAFANAAARWSSIIYGELTNVPVASAAGTICGATYPSISETVDDVLIFVTVDSIDGPGQILGSAGPCLYRAGSRFTAVGAMRFDIADLPLLESNGVFSAVILHEMGHVIGFGTLWTVPPSLLVGGGTSDPYFPGANAVDAYTAACGSCFGSRVPVEAGGGPGTRDAHWRESVMGAELMTGYISLVSNPLSAITVGSLRDMGYTVSSANADPYFVSSVNLRVGGLGGELHLREAAPEWTLQAIDAAGRITRGR
ncbi:MAG TPA: Ig-like domain-containing protein [Gemmatimonadales bacterium]|nr:Ig-like domain-containing protein [Gemmatimonadales bacterium]